MNTHEGYSKKKLSNDNVLLAGGGEKSLADFLGGIRISSSKIQYKAADSAAAWTDLITLVNTDENVKQVDNNNNQNSPILLKNGTGTGTITSSSIFADGVTVNPKNNALSVTGYIYGKILTTASNWNWRAFQLYDTNDANPSYYLEKCAIINITSYGGWQPWIRGVDNENGSWAIGQYTTNFHVAYIAKTNTDNSTTKRWDFGKDGKLTSPDGFVHGGFTPPTGVSKDAYVLLAGGGYKELGNGNGYVPVSNGTVNTNLNADTVDGYHAKEFTRALYYSHNNPNALADSGDTLAMISLADNGNVDNPGGKTGWHHFVNITWTDTSYYNGTTNNEWCTQIANACGTTDLWVRSRSGGSISNGTAWGAPWTRILTGSNWTSVITLPTVNNASLTLQTAGTTQTTFYANDSTNKTFNVTCDSIGAKLKSSTWLPETKVTKQNFKTYLDDANTNLHNLAYEELNLFRFYSADEAASTYEYPVVDSHSMVFSIDNNKNYLRLLNLDLRSNDIYTISRNGSTWRSWVRLLHSGNYTDYVKNASLTLQTDGTTLTTFYANDSTNRTFNVTCSNIGAATSGHDHDSRYMRIYPGVDVDLNTTHGYYSVMTTQSGINDSWWHVLHMDWAGGANWRSEIAIPTLGRTGVYYRSDGSGWAWTDWIGLLDTSSTNLTKTGNLTCANFYTTSDRNKKTNISSFSEHIRKFQLKDTEKWHYGVIALEVEEIFRDGEEGNMTVNYNSILSFYIGQLENRVKMLEERIKRLESK